MESVIDHTTRSLATRLQRACVAVGRVAVGVLFLGASVEKALNLADWQAIIGFFLRQLFSVQGVTISVAVVVAAAEPLIGIMLITGWQARIVSRVAIGALIVFSAALGWMLLDPTAPESCGCGRLATILKGELDEATFGLIRNALLLAILFVVARSPNPT